MNSDVGVLKREHCVEVSLVYGVERDERSQRSPPTSPTPTARRLRGLRPCCRSNRVESPCRCAWSRRRRQGAQSPRRSPVPWRGPGGQREHDHQRRRTPRVPSASSPTGFPVRLPANQALVSVVFARIRNVVISDLDPRVDECECALKVAERRRLVGPAHDLHVLLRHRPRSIRLSGLAGASGPASESPALKRRSNQPTKTNGAALADATTAASPTSLGPMVPAIKRSSDQAAPTRGIAHHRPIASPKGQTIGITLEVCLRETHDSPHLTSLAAPASLRGPSTPSSGEGLKGRTRGALVAAAADARQGPAR